MNEVDRPEQPIAGWVAMVLGIVAVASVTILVLFYVFGGPLGLINDVGNGLIGILSAVLAVVLRPRAGGVIGVVAAVVGAAVAVWGSWLVITATTGFLLAGFVSSVGYGLTGVWLATVAWSSFADGWSGGLRWLARVAAACMVIGGIAAVPGALMHIDDFAAVPPWLWLFSLGWLGTYLLYPAWSLAFGRRLVADAR